LPSIGHGGKRSDWWNLSVDVNEDPVGLAARTGVAFTLIAALFAFALDACSKTCRVSSDCASDQLCGPDGVCVARPPSMPPPYIPHDAGTMDAKTSTTNTRDGSTADASDGGLNDSGPIDAGPIDAAFQLTSTAFMDNGKIPVMNSGQGANLQPELAWTNAPQAASFAVVLIDTTIDYVHWVAFDIPSTTNMLAEGASNNSMLPPGTMQAMAYLGMTYHGPNPPAGETHSYQFRVYALRAPTVAFNASDPIRDAQLTLAFSPYLLGLAALHGTFP
jgi:Raf kinase inhibitor-like YbhB/YbcL family protein